MPNIKYHFSTQLTVLMCVSLPFILLAISGSIWPVASEQRKEMTAYGMAGAVAEEV